MIAGIVAGGRPVLPTSPPPVTLDPARKGPFAVLSNGNMTLSSSDAGVQRAGSTVGRTAGKWYFEMRLDSGQFGGSPALGIQLTSGSWAGDITAIAAYRSNGSRYLEGAHLYPWGAACTPSDVMMAAFDLDAKKIWFGRNGVWQVAGDPAAGLNPMGVYAASGEITPVIQVQGSVVATVRFATGVLTYAPPVGFSAWG